jgi:hypothetical protein
MIVIGQASLVGHSGSHVFAIVCPTLNSFGLHDIYRFPSAKKLVSYAGLAPGIRQSADHTVHGRITRDGNKHIRWILIEAPQNASRFDPKLRPFYLRIAARRGRRKAITAAARKMLVSIYHVLKRQENTTDNAMDYSKGKIPTTTDRDSSLQTK